MNSRSMLLILLLHANLSHAGKYFEHKKIGDISFNKFVACNNLYKFFYDTLGLRQYGVEYKIPFIKNAEVINYYQGMFAVSDGQSHYSYGDISAMAGDHSADPLQLFQGLFSNEFYADPAHDKIYKKLIAQLRHVTSLQNKAIDDGLNEASYYNPEYVLLASGDKSHFQLPPLGVEEMLCSIDDSLILLLDSERVYAADKNNAEQLARLRKQVTKKMFKLNNSAKYAILHLLALNYINGSATDYCMHDTNGFIKNFQFALIFNAYADHFLQDAFSAGHIPVQRSWRAMNNKGVHDYYCRHGLDVHNEKGDQWHTYGDDFYDEATFTYAIRADSVSISELWLYFNEVRDKITQNPAHIPESQLEEIAGNLISPDSISSYLHHNFSSFRYMPVPLDRKNYKEGIKLKRGSKNSMFMETGVLTYAYNPGLNIGWNIGMGLGFDLSNYKKKNNINTKRCGKSKETVWWACMAFNYSSATIDRINISTITGGFQVSYLDRIVAGVDLGSIHATGSYFLFRPLIGYEFKSLRCAIAPSLKLYFDLSNYKNEKTGFMLTMRLY